MRDKIEKLSKALGIYQECLSLWRCTVEPYKWIRRESGKVLKNRVMAVGDSILERSEGKKVVFVGYNSFAVHMKKFLESHGRSVYKCYVDGQEHFPGGYF